MANILDKLQKRFSPIRPLPAGMYTYTSPPEDPRNYQLHLRVDPGGDGILVINASTVLHLNQSAAEYAYSLVKNLPRDQAIKRMVDRYRITEIEAREDYEEVTGQILGVVNLPDLDPEVYLGIDRLSAFSGNISVPYRLDCALTYRLPDNQASENAPQDRVKTELSTAEWLKILDKAAKVGIPHIIFTGGDPALRPDLLELLQHLEKNSQVSGLISNGVGLNDPVFLDQLLNTGLDHLMLVIYPERGIHWEMIDRLVAADLYTVIHLTLTDSLQASYLEVLQQLANHGVSAVSLTTADPSLAGLMEAGRQKSAELGMELVWNMPVPYSAANPVALERNRMNQPEGVGRAWLYVEPDGDVQPDQAIQRPMGNLLSDPWAKIWKSHIRVSNA